MAIYYSSSKDEWPTKNLPFGPLRQSYVRRIKVARFEPFHGTRAGPFRVARDLMPKIRKVRTKRDRKVRVKWEAQQ